MVVWINGKTVADSEATVSLFDRSYLYGEGVFETLRCYNGKPAFFSQHFKRLQHSCKTLHLQFPLAEEELFDAVKQLLKADNKSNTLVRLTFSRMEAQKQNLTLFCRPVTIDPALYETGATLLPMQTVINDDAAIAGIKSTNYLTKMLARAEADKAGAYEALLKNRNGFWVEGSRSNLFLVTAGRITTPPLSDGILPGVTRQIVITLIKSLQFSLLEDHITTIKLKEADEIFITGSATEVMPVANILDMTEKEICPGPVTLKIREAYLEKLASS